VLPAKRLSARWCPVAEEFQGSKSLRVGCGAGPVVGLGGAMVCHGGVEETGRDIVG